MCKECKTCMNKVHCIFWSTFAVSLACHEHYILNNYNFTSFTKRHVKPTDLAKDFMYVLVVVKVTSTLFVSLILRLFTVSHSAWIALIELRYQNLRQLRISSIFAWNMKKKINACMNFIKKSVNYAVKLFWIVV